MPISGKEMLRLFEENGWRFLRQKGSHVRIKKNDAHATIPMHKELATGLEKYLFKRLVEVG